MDARGTLDRLTAERFAAERDEIGRLAERYNAKPEVELADGTRCDLLSPTVAWEVDWSDKWYQGVGQALYYGLRTSRKPGLILLTPDPGRRLAAVGPGSGNLRKTRN